MTSVDDILYAPLEEKTPSELISFEDIEKLTLNLGPELVSVPPAEYKAWNDPPKVRPAHDNRDYSFIQYNYNNYWPVTATAPTWYPSNYGIVSTNVWITIPSTTTTASTPYSIGTGSWI